MRFLFRTTLNNVHLHIKQSIIIVHISGPYPRAHFRDVLHTGLGMTDAYMMERVMVALDRGTTPYVTMQTFAKAFSLYLRGDLEERIAYAFTV